MKKPTRTKPIYRVRFVHDPDARFEECNGEARPLSAMEYDGNEYQKDGAAVSYAEYLRYYGNPDRHVYLGYELQQQCACCGEWKTVDSLWNIDFMDDNPEYLNIRIGVWYAPDDPALVGYVRDLVAEYRPMKKGGR